ncbi:MAG: hypothetical protein RBS72_19020 [Sedimentisphaerales bacterium]|jgi:hypothetical protein|nr:hypothetical protein [Sedimentisphaerales bacterium]NLZ04206.1 hypothetical protein [Phycisphaerae bacterium]HNY79822.1 hypothetical protein [Sedimentisphaerales bacterium]HOC64824.1 hypothetical protein [Sedimentisphaerales bacterium]HOH65754.1 hypothetical protein [Sedimentisphaerales bacterium]
MNEGPVNQSHMIETTDCLEAVGVFRGWKNFFFLLVVICLLLAQACFWLVNLRLVEIPAAPAEPETALEALSAAAAQTVAAGDEASTSAPAGTKKVRLPFIEKLTWKHIKRTVELVNGILIITAGLFCLAMFFSLMVSLIGRLGGINHIARAFFLSLIMFILIVPWQELIGSSVVGVAYTPAELVKWVSDKGSGFMYGVLFYLRFTIYWLLVMLLLIMSQARSARWTKAILRRLEII